MGASESDRRGHPERRADVQIWLVELAATTPLLLQLESKTPRLSPAEAARGALFPDRVSAQAWLAGHIALRLVLEHLLGAGVREVPYTISARGKPELMGADVAFSLSHSSGLALIAVGPSGPIGVDLEGEREIRMPADRRLAIEAAGRLAGRSPLPESGSSRFLQAWVRLEALAKAEGDGMARVLSRAGAFGPRRGLGVMEGWPPAHLVVSDLALGSGYYGAVAFGEGAAVASMAKMPTDTAGLAAFVAR